MADALSRNLKFTSEDKEEDHISVPIMAVNYITGNYQQYPDKLCNRPDEEGNFHRCHITIADIVHQKWLAYRLKETSKGVAPLLELSR